MYLLQLFLLTYVLGFSMSINYCSADETHALILARGGSRGISNKNLREVNGISLLGRTLTVLNESRLFEYIWVSTDSELIANVARKFGALVHMRDPLSAQDNTSSLESVNEFLQAHETVNRFALFQCTSIFLKDSYIRQALRRFETKDCVFAATRSYKLRWMFDADGRIVPLNFNPKRRPRRQDWTGELIETGMFYFATRSLVEYEHRFQNDKCDVVEIDAADAMEIDTCTDLLLAECLVQSKLEEANGNKCANMIENNN
ncbi:N-acylneuraminate cytidylyltransferase [Eurosta solidaginis]|uniref:N-acylneuraminate cytidylyltransferase n=1 Tax=Eurosta solidaginis TaxID=178769 RepID=UPI00353072A2